MWYKGSDRSSIQITTVPRSPLRQECGFRINVPSVLICSALIISNVKAFRLFKNEC